MIQLLSKFLNILEKSVTFLFGLSIGYKAGEKGKIELENKLSVTELEKELEVNKNAVNDRFALKSDADIVDELVGRKRE